MAWLLLFIILLSFSILVQHRHRHDSYRNRVKKHVQHFYFYSLLQLLFKSSNRTATTTKNTHKETQHTRRVQTQETTISSNVNSIHSPTIPNSNVNPFTFVAYSSNNALENATTCGILDDRLASTGHANANGFTGTIIDTCSIATLVLVTNCHVRGNVVERISGERSTHESSHCR